jgi:hypothetical protein
MRTLGHERFGGHMGYTPCPACLLAKPIVPLKACTCDRQRSVRIEPWGCSGPPADVNSN